MSFARFCKAAHRGMSTAASSTPGGTTAVQKLKKPKLKNLYVDGLITTIYAVLPISAAFSLYFYVAGVKKRVKIYEDFYALQSPERQMEEFEMMRQLGVFKSAAPDGKEMESLEYVE